MRSFAGIVAGLGNPGARYADTRHNFGFLAVDRLLGVLGAKRPCPEFPAGGDCLAWDCPLCGASSPHWLVLKPLTFMNLSGTAVTRLCRRFQIGPEQLLVLHDEMDLPLGRMKLKFGGGDAGHNGLKSLADELGTRDFHRLRLGVGRPEQRMDPADYVLSAFTPAEAQLLAPVLDLAVKGVRAFARKGFAAAAQMLNTFDAAPSPDATPVAP
jgi:peptidyl-tRNA hydrolase, PTH1 family